MNTLIAYAKALLATQFGQVLLSFLRVAAATVVGAWINAGSPLSPSGGDVTTWLELGISAGVTLVVVNYLGPWEKRYGRNKA